MDRQKLQTLLETILASEGVPSPNVYFQPPPSVQMKYPAIVYNRDDVDAKYAGNKPYSRTKRYELTVISSNADSKIPDRVGELPMTSYVRFFSANGLNHDVFTIYF